MPAVAGAIITAVITTAVSVGISYMANALFGTSKPKNPSFGTLGDSSPRYGFGALQNTVSSELPVADIYGEIKYAGNFLIQDPPDGGTQVSRALGVCMGEIERIYDVRFNDLPVSSDGQYVGVDLGAGNAKQIEELRIRNGSSEGIKNFILQGSHDKASWDDVYSDTALDNSSLQSFGFTNNISYRYWRLLSDGEGYAQRSLHIHEIELREQGGSDETSGKEYFASHENDESHLAESTFDDNDSTYWAPKYEISAENTFTVYKGTGTQDIDSRFSGKIEYAWRNLAYIACTFKADEKLKGDVTVTGIIRGRKIRTWNPVGEVWEGSNFSDNPAAVLRDFLTNAVNGAGLSEAKIDDDSFGEAAEYCDELVADNEGDYQKRYTIGLAVDQRRPAIDIINDILITFGGVLVESEGVYILRVRKPESAVMSFDDGIMGNNSNIIKGSFGFSKHSKDDCANRVIFQYIDPQQNWTKIRALAEDKIAQDERADYENTDGIVTKEIEGLGVTRFSQGSRLAMMYVNELKYTPITCSFRTTIKALPLDAYDVITISHSLPNWTNKPFRVISVKELENDEKEITATEYNASIYNDQYGSSIANYDYGSPANPLAPPPAPSNVQLTEGGENTGSGEWLAWLDVTFDAPADITYISHYQIEYDIDGAGYVVCGSSLGTTFRINGCLAGKEYTIRVKAISTHNIESDPAYSPPYTVIGKEAPPADVSGFSYTFLNEIVLSWNNNSDVDLAGYEIRTQDADWGVDNSYLVYRGLADTFTIVTPSSRNPGTYYIKAFDSSGNYSENSQSVTPSNPAPAQPAIAAVQWFGFAKIEWSDVSDTDLKYYEVYKSPTNDWTGEEFLEAKVPGTAVIVQGNAPCDAKADSADAVSITDADLAGYGVNYFLGDVILQTSGTYKGQETVITAYNNSTGQVSVASWPAGTPSVDDEFVIKDRAYFKVRARDTFGPGNFSSAVTINFTPLTEAEIGDAVISARKLIAGELITLSAQIKDLIVTDAKILSLHGSKIVAESITLSKLAGDAVPPKTYYQTDEPVSGMNEGDYWIDTDDDNKLYIYQSGTWQVVSESGGGGGITVFRQDSIPTALSTGDLWIDTDDGDKMYRATNPGDDEITPGEWELIDAATATGWAHPSDTTLIDGGNIYTGTVTADAIAAGAVTADKIDVNQLDAVNTNTGTLNVDEYIKAGDNVFIDGANEVFKVFSDTVVIASDENDKLNWQENAGSEKTATLTAGSYSPTALAAHVQSLMRAQGDADTTVVYDSGTRKITIANSTLSSLTLKWSSGTNADKTCGRALGFDVTADDTGLLSYTSDYQTALRVELGKLS